MSNANPRPLTSMLTADIATRMAAFDFSLLGQLLPNPDPLLKELGKDIKIYRDLVRDSHVGACVRRRKAAVLSLEWGLDRGQARSRVARSVEDMLSALDMQQIIRQALDACQFGYQPMEIRWAGTGGGLWVADVQAKPAEWFCFNDDAQLRFKTKANPVYGEPLPERKFLLPRQDPSYQNPYGFADLSLCYWPVLFKKGGMRFWLTFAEKYGGAFAIGKLPRTASEAERQAMLQALEDMLQDAVATVPDDGSVELVELAGKAASGDLYERLALWCRGEISIVQTGTNQTVEASANKASAHAGMDVAEDLRDADAGVVAAAVNQLIRWVVDRNYPGAAAPVFEMWDQQAQDELQASRDKSNYDAGARFTNAYWMRAYGYQEGDLAAAAAPAAPDPAGRGHLGQAAAVAGAAADQAEFAEGTPTAEPTDDQVDPLSAAGEATWQTWLGQLQALVDQADSPQALQAALAAQFEHLAPDDLVKLMAAAFALAELRGMADAATQ